MSVEVTNETAWQIDGKSFPTSAVWVMSQIEGQHTIRPDHHVRGPGSIAQLHMRWMNSQGPPTSCSFQWTNCAPETAEPKWKACWRHRAMPVGAAQQALAAGHSTMEEMMLLTIHGILHLLGYDHVTPEQERQMFGLQRQLLLTFFALRQGAGAQATLPAGTPDALAEWDREHGAGGKTAK